jgi:hypothetical protein
MTIRDADKFMAGFWDWGFLRGCFGQSKIAPTDIDGFVERHGKFLVIETKRPGAPVPLGQLMTFQAMQANGAFTVIVVWGFTNKPETMRIYTASTTSKMLVCTDEILRKLVTRWYACADKNRELILSADLLEPRTKEVSIPW